MGNSQVGVSESGVKESFKCDHFNTHTKGPKQPILLSVTCQCARVPVNVVVSHVIIRSVH